MAGRCLGIMSAMRIKQISEWGEAHFSDPASPASIATLETALGDSLPEELRDLLLEANGIEGEYGLGLLWPAERIASDNLLFRTSDDFTDLYMPFQGLIFFADAGNGDQFFVSLSGTNEIYVWDHENDGRTWVAATVLDYLESWMKGDLIV